VTGGHGVRRWPLFLIALPAAVAVWSGWVGLGQLCGFGMVQPFPGIVAWHLDTAITLPVGVESYGAYALGAWLTPGTPERARTFARRSAIGALALGMLGQVVYHLLAAAHATRAPWPVVVLVSCLPVVTLGFGAGLAHLLRADESRQQLAESETEIGRSSAESEDAAEPEIRNGVSDLAPAEIARASGDLPAGSGRSFADLTPAPDTVSVPAGPRDDVGQLTPVPSTAAEAAAASLRATIAAGNPLSVNQLAERFSLTRSQATKVRRLVLAESNGHAPEESEGA
jgi:hypothetical protein